MASGESEQLATMIGDMGGQEHGEDTKLQETAVQDETDVTLKEATSRREQFRDWLSERAKPRQRVVPVASPEDLAKRLEERLLAAEKKREKRQALDRQRRARLEATRQLAKSEAQSRLEQKLALYESKLALMESKKAARLEVGERRRAAAQERIVQLHAQREAIARLDDERLAQIHAALMRRLAAAERKRCAWIAAERTRAAAVFARSRQVAASVWKKREAQSMAKRETWEAKVVRARLRRAEILRQKGGCIGYRHCHSRKRAGERLSKKLSRCWRQFRRTRSTTLTLADAFVSCQINSAAVKRLPFEDLAKRITSPATLQAVKAFLDRVESRLVLTSSTMSKSGTALRMEVNDGGATTMMSATTSAVTEETTLLTSAGSTDSGGLRNLDYWLKKLQQPKKGVSRPHLRGNAKKGGPMSGNRTKTSESVKLGSHGKYERALTSSSKPLDPQKSEDVGEKFVSDVPKRGRARQTVDSVSVEKNKQMENQNSAKKGAIATMTENQYLERYPSRVFLCAFMILGHPEAVFSGQGNKEKALAKSAAQLVAKFEMLLAFIMQTKRQHGNKLGHEIDKKTPASTCVTAPMSFTPEQPGNCLTTPPQLSPTVLSQSPPSTPNPSDVAQLTSIQSRSPVPPSLSSTVFPSLSPVPSTRHRSEDNLGRDSPTSQGMSDVTSESKSARRPFSEVLQTFDNAWADYLEHFVKWKVQDAEVLEEDLVGMACQLEESMLQCRERMSTFSLNSHDFLAIKEQVKIDHQLLRNRILQLSGVTGVARMESALVRIRNRYPPPLSNQEEDSVSPTPISPSPAGSPSLSVSTPLSSYPQSSEPVHMSSSSSPLTRSVPDQSNAFSPPSSAASPRDTDSNDEAISLAGKSPTTTQTVTEAHVGKERLSPSPSTSAPKIRRSLFKFPDPKVKQVSKSPEVKGDGKLDKETSESVKAHSSLCPEKRDTEPNSTMGVVKIDQNFTEIDGKDRDDEKERMVQEMFYAGRVTMNPDQQGSENLNLSSMLPDSSLLGGTEGERKGPSLVMETQKTVENAFWDVFHGHLLEDPPETEHFLNLVSELRTEIEALSPATWRTEIQDNVDTEILRQMMDSGSFDLEYVRKILDYVLGIFLRLGVPARDGETENAYQKIIAELSSDVAINATPEDVNAVRRIFASAVTKGLRFMFDQLKILKRDVKTFQMSQLVNFVQSQAGLDFQRDKFFKRFNLSPSNSLQKTVPTEKSLALSLHGSPGLSYSAEEISAKLPKTFSWLVRAKEVLSFAKSEIEEAIGAVVVNENMDKSNFEISVGETSRKDSHPQGSSSSNKISVKSGYDSDEKRLLLGAVASMKTGGNVAKGLHVKREAADTGHRIGKFQGMNQQNPTDWKSPAAIVRLGLIQTVTSSTGVSEENAPETLRLDAIRIRNLQNEFQQILVTAIGLLLVRTVGASTAPRRRIEAALEFTKDELSRLLKSPTASMDTIADVLSSSLSVRVSEVSEEVVSQAPSGSGGPAPNKEMMKRMLVKALTPGDIIFGRVSKMIGSAMRALVLETVHVGLKAARDFLSKGGGGSLLDDVVKLAEKIDEVADVTVYVHEPWYKVFVESL